MNKAEALVSSFSISSISKGDYFLNNTAIQQWVNNVYTDNKLQNPPFLLLLLLFLLLLRESFVNKLTCEQLLIKRAKTSGLDFDLYDY